MANRVPAMARVSANKSSARRCAAVVETIKIPSPEAGPAQIYGRGRFNLVNERLKAKLCQ